MLSLYVWLILPVVVYFLYKLPSRRRQPPGPIGLPFVGYLPFLDDKKKLVQQLESLARKYGDVFMLQLGNHDVLVLQSRTAIVEALKRDDLNGRPTSTASATISRQAGYGSLFFGDGKEWAENKNIMARAIKVWGGVSGRQKLEHIYQDAWNHLRSLIDQGDGESVASLEVISSATLPFMWTILYGGDHNKAIADQFNKLFEEKLLLAPELGLWCEYVGIVQRWNRSKIDEIVDGARGMLRLSTTRCDSETAVTGLIHELYSLAEDTSDSHSSDRLSQIVAEAYLGTFDTCATLSFIVGYLSQNPRSQTKLQEAVDKVAAQTGAHNQEFWENLFEHPYMRACVTEGARCGTECFGMQRQAVNACEFRGYLIPEGTVVIGNLLAANKDPSTFVNPDQFNPERFILDDGTFDAALANKVLTFSTGKRRCIGAEVAYRYMAAMLGSLALRYDWKMTKGFDALSSPVFYDHMVEPAYHEIQFQNRVRIDC